MTPKEFEYYQHGKRFGAGLYGLVAFGLGLIVGMAMGSLF